MKAKLAALIIFIALVFLGLGLLIGAYSFYASTTKVWIAGANDCCSYVDAIVLAEMNGELDQIPLGLFENECSLKSGFMVSHEYNGNVFIEFRSFCGSRTRSGGPSSIEVSVVYVTTLDELQGSTGYSLEFPVYVEITSSNPSESVLGSHSARGHVIDREGYDLYLESLER